MALPLRKDTPQENQPNPGQVRRVQTHFNDDWRYLDKGQEAANDPAHPTVADEFNASDRGYADKMLGPTQIGTRQEAADQEEFEQNPTRRDSGRRYPSAGLKPGLIETEDETKETPIQRTRTVLKNLPSLSAKTMISRTRAIAINSETMAWHVPLWLTFQLPLAIFNIITLAAVGAIDSVTTTTENSGLIATTFSKLAGAAIDIASFVGVDFFEIAFALFMITYILILGFGVLSILLLFLQYKIALLNPLSGNGAGFKMGMLLLAIIGYSIPMANLIPFVFLWMLSVAIYPK